MRHAQSTNNLRAKLKERLQTWMPDSPALVEKELSIFDSLMSRRDFLKTASVSAMSAFILHGCGGPPSQWGRSSGVTGAEQAGVTTPSKIIVDADILDGMQSYEALAAAGSSDANWINDNAILESFNPHIMTVDSLDNLQQSGFQQTNRSYGAPEIVHLVKSSSNDPYQLAIYEKTQDGTGGLKESIVSLAGTASMTFQNIVATNGSFHNKSDDAKAYSQKMVLLSNEGTDFDLNSSQVPLQLYYQASSNMLLMPGVEFVDSGTWQQMDIISVFKQGESSLTFNKYRILEIQKYHDGSNNSFLYGTLQFDSYYNYGFVITFNALDATQPTVTFFAPYYLSKNYAKLTNLINDFNNSGLKTSDTLNHFAIFSGQCFRPFSQMVDAKGDPTSEILFTFLSFDTTSTTDGASPPADSQSGVIQVANFTDATKSIVKRYILSVDTSPKKPVIYLFDGYYPDISFKIIRQHPQQFSITFNISAMLPVFDLWHDFYDSKDDQTKNAFVRFAKNDGNKTTLLLATSYYDGGNSLGVSHKSITIARDRGGFSKVDAKSVNTLFDNAYLDGNRYLELWFNDMKGHLNNYASLAECVKQYGLGFDFHCAHNPQGLLRSYYIVRYLNSDGSINSFLVGYNEIGNEQGDTFAYQDFASLLNDINNSEVSHNPPLPIAIDAYTMHPWHTIGQDGEVLYTAARSKKTDETSKAVVANTSKALLGYHHATCDNVEKIWSRFEQEKQVKKEDQASKQYKISNHYVTLTATNIYDQPVSLGEDTYLELRFSKPVIVQDYTDIANVKTYQATRQTSLFLKTDDNGKVLLVVDVGTSSNEKYNGATMMYRFLDSSALTMQNNQPIAVLTTTNGTTSAFKQCNISYNAFDRLAGTLQPGIKQDGKLSDRLKAGFGQNGTNDTVNSVTGAYAKVRDAAKPLNDSPITNLSLLYANGLSIRWGRRISLISGVETPIDPLTFVPMLHSGGQRAFTRKLSFKLSFKSVAKWVKHAATTVVDTATDAAKKLQDDMKNAVTKFANDIGTIVTNIASSLANAIGDLADAIIKLAKDIYDLAKWLWNFIMGALDFEAAWEIGQQLKNIYHGQFDAGGTVYNLLKNNTGTIQSAINSSFDTIKTNLDGAIDTAFGDSASLDAQRDSSKEITKNIQKCASKINFILDKLSRLPSISSPDLLPSEKVLSSETENQISTMLNKVAQTTIDNVSGNAEKVAITLTDFFNNKGMDALKKDLKSDLKGCINTIFDDAKIVVADSVQLLPTILADSTLKSYITKRPDSIIENPIFETLSWLLFFDIKTASRTHKFDYNEDFAYFCYGYIINLSESIFGDALQYNGNKFDIAGYIKDGSFGNDIKSITSSSSKSLKAIGTNNIEEVTLALSVIDLLVNISQSAVDAAIAVKRGPAGEILKWMKRHLNYGYLVRAAVQCALFVVAIISFDSNKKTVSSLKAYNRFGLIFVNIYRFISTQYETDIKAIKDGDLWVYYMSSDTANMLTQLSAFLAAVLDDTDDEYKKWTGRAYFFSLLQAATQFFTDDQNAKILADPATPKKPYYVGMGIFIGLAVTSTGCIIESDN